MEKQSDKAMLQNKARALWADKRTYGKRLVLAGAAMLAACFTFVFFGPLEMVAFGVNSLIFTYEDVIGLLFVAMAILTVFGTLIISLLRGKIFNYVIAIIFTVTVAGYLQAALLNGSVGALTGETVEWAEMKREMVISVLAWLAVFLAVITVLYFHRAVWRKMVIGVSLLLVVMQCAPLVGILLGAYEEAKIPEIAKASFSNDGIQEFSSEDNVLVFILDYMDYDFVETLYNEDPTFFDDFKGFTGYSNAVSTFGRTRPSVCNILTQYTEGAYEITESEFLNNAWKYRETNILDVLQEKGYSIEMYASISDIFASSETAANYVANMKLPHEVEVEIIPSMMLKKLMYLSVYRYAPMVIKPFFWEYTDFYNEGVCKGSSDSDVFELLLDAQANRAEKNFKFYHLEGSHPPCYLNREGMRMPTQTNEYEQTIGCLHLLKNVFARMQELGIYEDATIILTADHGDAGKLFENNFNGMQIALFYKPAGSEDAPMVWSDAQVSTTNIPATIADAVGADSAQFGVTLDAVGDETNERTFYRVYGIEAKSFKEQYFDIYTVTGDAGDPANWSLVDTKRVLNAFY